MRFASTTLLAALAVLASACAPDASPSVQPGTVNSPPVNCACPTTGDGGVCVCENVSLPACPPHFNFEMPGPCSVGAVCIACSGADGVQCRCNSGDGGKGEWQCLDTEEGCSGGYGF